MKQEHGKKINQQRRTIIKYCDYILKDIDERLEKSRRAEEVCKAVELLKPLLERLAEGRGETVCIYGATEAARGDLIIVRINDITYEINVTAKNLQLMVQSVVDRVILKL